MFEFCINDNIKNFSNEQHKILCEELLNQFKKQNINYTLYKISEGLTLENSVCSDDEALTFLYTLKTNPTTLDDVIPSIMICSENGYIIIHNLPHETVAKDFYNYIYCEEHDASLHGARCKKFMIFMGKVIIETTYALLTPEVQILRQLLIDINRFATTHDYNKAYNNYLTKINNHY